MTRRYFYPLLSDFSMYNNLPSAKPENLAVASISASRVLCLPIYPDLSIKDQQRIIACVKGVFIDNLDCPIFNGQLSLKQIAIKKEAIVKEYA